MLKLNLLIILSLCVAGAIPAYSASRWFSSSWYDLRVAMLRYGHCIGDLSPLSDSVYSNETDYLVNQMKIFLDQGSYENEQLANISALMDNICRESSLPEIFESYPISVHIDVNKYSNSSGKNNRCNAINEAMDAMYPILKKASLNKSEPLDFSVIQFYPNASNLEKSYNLTDLINTSWITSETNLEQVCYITKSFKDHIRNITRNSVASDRSHQDHAGFISTLLEFIDKILDPILGLQKRLYWDSNNRIALVFHGVGNQLNNLGSVLGKTYNSTKNAIFGRTGSSNITTNLNSSMIATTPLPKASNVTL